MANRPTRRWSKASVLATPALLILLLVTGCIDPIDVDTGPPENKLVVQGLVTEGPGPHEVKLTRSAAFRRGIDALRPAERNAIVTITTGDGAEYVLTEVFGGRYQTAFGELVGEPGQSYALRIQLTDGTVFATEPATMREAPPVLDTYGEFEYDQTVVGNTLIEKPQISLFADAATDPMVPTFYRWMWRGIYAANACVGMSCQTCYIETEGTSLVEIGDNSLVGGPVLPNQRVHDFPLPDDILLLLQAMYVEVEQQSLTPEAYAFWSLIRSTRDQVGSLFDPPPDAAVGNVRNVENPDDFALGYFTVAGTATKGTCLRLGDFPDRPPMQSDGYIGGVCGESVPGTTTMPTAFRDACFPDGV